MAGRSRAELIAYAVAGVLLLVAAVHFIGGRGGGEDAPPVALDGARPADGTGGAGARGRQLFVHVAGAVRRPGLHQVPAGSRVAAAIDAAGGFGRRADLTRVNLAASLQDGQQVVVPRRGEGGPGTAPTAGASAGGEGSGPSAPISLGSATAEQLDTIDGIGMTLANRILEYRDQHGGFRSVDQLREVDGIGEKRFEALRKALTP